MMDLQEKISEGRKLVESESYVRVVSHHDVDGISAAAIITNYLRSQKKGFRCSLLKNVNGELEEILAEDNELLIVCDMGSSYIEAVEAAGRYVIILDHHQPIRESRSDMVLQINAHMHGINGSAEACAATLAYAFAGDISLISFMISGALGDRQGTEFKGLNRKFVDEAVEKGIVKVDMGLTIDCYDRKNIQRMVTSSMAPFLEGCLAEMTERRTWQRCLKARVKKP
jgi:RecJ-like exonuclease